MGYGQHPQPFVAAGVDDLDRHPPCLSLAQPGRSREGKAHEAAERVECAPLHRAHVVERPGQPIPLAPVGEERLGRCRRSGRRSPCRETMPRCAAGRSGRACCSPGRRRPCPRPRQRTPRPPGASDPSRGARLKTVKSWLPGCVFSRSSMATSGRISAMCRRSFGWLALSMASCAAASNPNPANTTSSYPARLALRIASSTCIAATLPTSGPMLTATFRSSPVPFSHSPSAWTQSRAGQRLDAG